MIDLDAIKAAGRNSADHSGELMRLDVWRRRVEIHGELCRFAVGYGNAGQVQGEALWAQACERVPMPGWVAA